MQGLKRSSKITSATDSQRARLNFRFLHPRYMAMRSVVLVSIEINNNLSRLNETSVKGDARIRTPARRIIACGQIYDTIVRCYTSVFNVLGNPNRSGNA